MPTEMGGMPTKINLSTPQKAPNVLSGGERRVIRIWPSCYRAGVIVLSDSIHRARIAGFPALSSNLGSR